MREVAHYLIGMIEMNNRGSVSTWKRGHFPAGYFMQVIGVITDVDVVLVPVAYSAYTGQLTDESCQLLESGDYRQLVEQVSKRPGLGLVEQKQIASGPEVGLQTAIEQCLDDEEREKLIELEKALRHRTPKVLQ